MKFNLSLREKRLLALLMVIIALFLWYRVSWDHLWPIYQKLLQEQQDYFLRESELPLLMGKIKDQEKLLAQLRSRIDKLKNELSPGAGFLIHTVSQLAEGKVTITEMEPGNSRGGPFYQENTLRIVFEGEFSEVMEYLRLLEDQPALHIGFLDIKREQETVETLQVDLLLHHFVVHQDKGTQPIGPSTFYSSYHVLNPFAVETVPDVPESEMLPEEETAISEEQKSYPLAPYTFPLR